MYAVYIEKNVQKWLKKQHSKIFSAIIKDIQELKNNPRPPGCRKLKGIDNLWRIRSGDFRILFEIKEEERVVKIMYIRNRKDVYKNLII